MEALFLPSEHSCVTVLEAPAGYGKTTLLVQGYSFAGAQGAKTAWLSLDEDDRDERSFLGYLIASLAEAGVDTGGLASLAEQGLVGATAKSVLSALLNRLHDHDGAIMIFLDDWHRAQSAAIAEALDVLISRAPPRCGFALATRVRPHINLSKLLAEGRLLPLTASELRFSFEEGKAVLERYGSSKDISLIVDRAEGWPVVLQLVTASLSRGRLHWSEVLSFSGETRELADYLSEQVFAALPEATREVLLRTSILERVNGDIINCLCGRSDGWELLDSFVRQDLLIHAIDPEGHWFRYHNVFSDFLRARLQRKLGPDVCALHRAAADWFAANGLYHEAVRHANLTGDPQYTADVLTRAGGWWVAFRGGLAVLRIIDQLPEESLNRFPYLRLGQIYLLAQDNKLDKARSLFDALTREHLAADAPAPTDELLRINAAVMEALLNIYAGRSLSIRSLQRLQQQTRAADRVPSLVSSMVTHLLGYALHCAGEYHEAKRVAAEAMTQCRDAGAVYVEVYSHMALGLAHFELTEISKALSCFETAADAASRHFGPYSSLVSTARVFLAEVAYERGDLTGASALLEDALPEMESRDNWFEVCTSAYRTTSAITAQMSTWQQAASLLERAQEKLEQKSLHTAALYLVIRRAEILTSAAEWTQAAELLSSEELRVVLNGGTEDRRLRVAAGFAVARLEIARGNMRAATGRLRPLIAEFEQASNTRRLIKAHTLLAAALHREGNLDAAAHSLRSALTLAATGGLVAPIVEEAASIHGLLESPVVSADTLPEIEAQLLAAIVARVAAHWTRRKEPAGEDASSSSRGQLSTREQELLRLLADGLSGKEIAGRMNLSVSTIVSYRKNLYRKLSSHSRSQAIARGRNFGYL